MRTMIMQSLRDSGLADFEFTEAEDGEDALAKFDPKETGIAFVDWNMPKMTGIEFVRKVRALGGTEDIPMVMVTSERTMGKVEEALDSAGADLYICKPFTVDYLKHKLEKLLRQVQVKKMRKLREQKLLSEPKESGGFLSRLFG
jgi:two-component system chemotaxis response regulator CheY